MTGTIKTIVELTDFGFIRGEDQVEYFFHMRDTDSDEAFFALQKGDAVAFDVMTPAPLKGPRARNVVALVPAKSRPGEVISA